MHPTLMSKQRRPLTFFSHCCDPVASTQLRTGVGRTTLITKRQDAPFSKGHALSNLLFEQIMLMGSTWSISEIRVWKFLYLIRKSKRPLPAPDMGQEGEDGSVFDQIVSRGRKWNLI